MSMVATTPTKRQSKTTPTTKPANHHMEREWEEGKYAPYQVQISGTLPGPVDVRAATLASSAALIWLPQDSPETIRPISEERLARLEALVQLRASGVLSGDEYADKRREAIHAEHHVHGPECSHGHDHAHGHSH